MDRLHLADIRGGEAEMEFGPEDKRPSERTAALLDYHCNVLYVHEKTGGIGHSAITKYIRIAGQSSENISVEVTMNQGGLERLGEKPHSLFKVRIAGLTDSSQLHETGKGDAAILRTIRTFDSPKLIVKAELERNNEGTLHEVLETAAALIGWNTQFGRKKVVKEVSIGVRDESGETEEIIVNLLKDRVLYLEDIELDGARDLTDAHRYSAVINAWQRYHVELRAKFAIQNVPGASV